MKYKFGIGDLVQFRQTEQKYPFIILDRGKMDKTGILYHVQTIIDNKISNHFSEEVELEKYVKSKQQKSDRNWTNALDIFAKNRNNLAI